MTFQKRKTMETGELSVVAQGYVGEKNSQSTEDFQGSELFCMIP